MTHEPNLERRLAPVRALLLTGWMLLASSGYCRAEPRLNISLTVDWGPDRGQNHGTLFELLDGDGNVVAGAGFAGTYNTYARGERQQLQVFIKPRNRPADWEIERLPPVDATVTGFYPLLLGGELYIQNRHAGELRSYHWNRAQRTWENAPDVHPQAQWISGRLLRRQGEQLICDGVVLVDAARTGEQIGEFYYAQGRLLVRQSRGEGAVPANRIAVYPWQPEQPPSGLLLPEAEREHTLSVPHEFFYTFGQWQDHVIGITNVGTVLRLADTGWQVLREPVLNVSYQVYCGINFYDKLLLGQYPTGHMFEYTGDLVTPRDGWPPVMEGVSAAARELQTAAIYGGELYVGVWPWAEVWRYDTNVSQWRFVQRMFRHPEPTD